MDQGVIGNAEEYGFSCQEEMVDYILGENYDVRSFRPGEEDKEEQADILRRLSPKCPSCLDELAEMLSEGAMRGEVDKDPNVTTQAWTDSRESHQRGVDEVEQYVFTAYCEEHDDEMFFSYEEERRD